MRSMRPAGQIPPRGCSNSRGGRIRRETPRRWKIIVRCRPGPRRPHLSHPSGCREGRPAGLSGISAKSVFDQRQKLRTVQSGTPDRLSFIDEVHLAQMNCPVQHPSSADQVSSDHILLLDGKAGPKCHQCPYCFGLGWVCENHPHLPWTADALGC